MEKRTNIQRGFTEEQTALIKRTVAVGATDDELKLFLHQATRTGLDPLARQIYFVKRAEKVSIQTSIDGFRIIAERSGAYAGQDAPEFRKAQKFDGTKDICCKVNVFRWSLANERYIAAVGVAYWSEYSPQAGQDFMWKKMPKTMLAKVAEALALRKAFPQDLSGLYTSDEMGEEGKETPEALEFDPYDELGASKAREAREQAKRTGAKTVGEVKDELEKMFGT